MLPTFDSVDDFLLKVATVRGKLKNGGIVDVEAAARIVLHDWNEGKIPYYSMPPTRVQGIPSEARVVSELGKEFNIDEVYKNESSFIGSLKYVDDFQPVEVPTSYPLNFDEAMLEEDDQHQISTQGNEEREDTPEYDEDLPMASEEDNAGKIKAITAARRQNEKLYSADGILNTKMRKAEMKRRKKAKKVDAMDDDYDFKVDYVKKGSSMDVGEGSDGDDDNPITAEVPMFGVDFGEDE